jgi:hypothetical protein
MQETGNGGLGGKLSEFSFGRKPMLLSSRILLVLVTEMIFKEERNQIAIETGSPFPSWPVGPGLSNPFPAIFNI